MTAIAALRRLAIPPPPKPAPQPEPKIGPCRGNCYVTCEALYHLLGGKEAGYTPHTVRHEGGVHWYLVRTSHGHAYVGDEQVPILMILDPTASQFATPPPYHLGRGRGFLTRRPSKRARELMNRLLWQYPPEPARSTKRRTRR